MSDELPTNKDAILNRIEQLLWRHFPDEPSPNGPSWDQEPYRSDFFEAFTDSKGQVTSEDLNKFVHDNWNVHREHALPTSERRELHSLIGAWGEWHYARRKLMEE